MDALRASCGRKVFVFFSSGVCCRYTMGEAAIEGASSESGLSANGGPAMSSASAPARSKSSLKRQESIERAKAFGEAFKVYLFIECCIWLPGCYLACYRFAPTLRLMQTKTGRDLVHRSSNALERWTPKWHARLTELSSKIHGAPAGRAFAEWALINKILAPIGFPTKMWIAHKIVSSREPPPPPAPSHLPP